MFKKNLHKQQVQMDDSITTLSLLSINGESLLEFPPDVVNSMRYMITHLAYKDTLPPRMALVSPLRQEGVTYVSRALATTLVNDLKVSVCIVELNWWWPDTSLEITSNSGGMAAVLNGDTTLMEAIVHTGSPDLDILPSGKVASKDRPVLARSTRLKEVISDLSQHYDHLILDVPAILATNDAIPLASLANACCLLIHQGATSLENTRLALDEISHLKIMGVIMNKVQTSIPSWLLTLIPQDKGPVTSV